MSTVSAFVRPRFGWAFLGILLLSAAISTAVATYFYNTSFQAFLSQKAEEKTTALRLVDAFVTTYSRIRSQFAPSAPVPATFRAHSIESFNQQFGSSGAFALHWVGRQGRHITTPPIDAETAKTIEEFAAAAVPQPRSALMTVNDRRVLRTAYPSLANEQSCVNCHNELQSNKQQWRLNDVMGAFVIDVPVGPIVQGLKTQSYAVALGLFVALSGSGLAVSMFYFRQLGEREAAASQLQIQNIRFNAALNNMSQGLCMFGPDRRLVVCNERYARLYALPPELVEPGATHEDIIKHRVSHGILAGERTDAAASEKLAALSTHSADKASSRIDKLADGRLIKVTREPMPGGGWVATHEDVTEQAHRASINSAISSFRERVESVLRSVRECTKTLKATSSDLFGSSEQTSRRAEGILEASSEASDNVQNAAAASRQMSTSATEIGRHIGQAADVVGSAVSKVQKTSEEFVELSNSAQKIGDVVDLIQQISGQTNLLALNATIEAARAGDAGRGFSVVASEVKSLALQTRKATEEIAGQISAIQGSTQGAIQAVGSIEECIHEISAYTRSVADSIEEQSAATLQISNNVADAAAKTNKIVVALGEVNDAATATRSSAETVLSASDSVESAIADLHREVETFLGSVAA